jgi:methionine synthase I (cobalamin-dependent)
MESLMKEFAYGNITPAERSFRRDSEYGEAYEKAIKLQDKLFKKINEEDKILLEEFIDAQCNLAAIEATDKLIYGLSFGLMITAEAFVNMKNILTNGKDE